MEWCLNSLEPQQVESMPQQVECLGRTRRRIKTKILPAKVHARFGNITLTRAICRQWRHDRKIALLEITLGIECGMTPSAQDFVGRQMATIGSSHGRCIEVIAERTVVTIGPEKLRNQNSHLAIIMEPKREVCLVKQLEEWIDVARTHSKTEPLAVWRDGVTSESRRSETSK